MISLLYIGKCCMILLLHWVELMLYFLYFLGFFSKIVDKLDNEERQWWSWLAKVMKDRKCLWPQLLMEDCELVDWCCDPNQGSWPKARARQRGNMSRTNIPASTSHLVSRASMRHLWLQIACQLATDLVKTWDTKSIGTQAHQANNVGVPPKFNCNNSSLLQV